MRMKQAMVAQQRETMRVSRDLNMGASTILCAGACQQAFTMFAAAACSPCGPKGMGKEVSQAVRFFDAGEPARSRWAPCEYSTWRRKAQDLLDAQVLGISSRDKKSGNSGAVARLRALGPRGGWMGLCKKFPFVNFMVLRGFDSYAPATVYFPWNKAMDTEIRGKGGDLLAETIHTGNCSRKNILQLESFSIIATNTARCC